MLEGPLEQLDKSLCLALGVDDGSYDWWETVRKSFRLLTWINKQVSSPLTSTGALDPNSSVLEASPIQATIPSSTSATSQCSANSTRQEMGTILL